jgi:lambda family phage tail tape measure protein
MADLSYTVAIEATGAQATLAKLNKQVDGVSAAFGSLKTALAGIAFGAMIANANRFADSISDLSDATEISIQNILGFTAAVAANGGTVEGAQKGLAKLVAEIDDAANVAGAGREAFKDVGVSLDDLRTKTSSQIFDQAIKGLAGISDVATRARLATQLLGKEAKMINFKSVSDDFNAASASSAKYASAIKSGADAQQSMETNMKNMSVALLQVVEPLNKLIAGLNVSVDTFASVFKVIGYAAGAFLIFGKGLGVVKGTLDVLLPALRGVGGVFAWFGAQIMLMVGNFGQIFTNLAKMVGALFGAGTASVSLAAALGAALRVGLRFLGLVGVVMAVVEAVNFLIKAVTGFDVLDAAITKFGELYDAAKKYLGLGQAEGPKGRSYSQEDAKRMQEDFDARTAAIKRGQEAMDKFKGEVAKANLESKQSLQIENASLVSVGFRLALERSLVGASEDQKEMQTKLAELEMARIDKQNEYARLVKKLQQEQSTTKDEEQNKLLGARIAIIQEEAKQSSAMYTQQNAYIATQLQLLQNAKMIEDARLQDQQNMVKAIEDQISRQQQLGDLMQSANDKLVDVKFAGAQAGKSPLQQQFDQIQEDARKAALEAGRAFSAGFEGMDLTTAQSKELADGLEQIAQKYKAIATEQTGQLEASRSFEAGWKKAFNSYADDATNAAKRAGDLFNAVTSSMNSAIDNFVDNGKFSFSDFASSLIKDMLKIELKASAMNLMKMMGGAGGGGGGGGILSGIAGLLGFADGGDPPVGKASIVGEKGPELFVPKKAGTIIPNGAAVAGAGGGGQQISNTYITNNISAIDSKSVAQLFTENRRLLLGSVKAAEKELPYRAR